MQCLWGVWVCRPCPGDAEWGPVISPVQSEVWTLPFWSVDHPVQLSPTCHGVTQERLEEHVPPLWRPVSGWCLQEWSSKETQVWLAPFLGCLDCVRSSRKASSQPVFTLFTTLLKNVVHFEERYVRTCGDRLGTTHLRGETSTACGWGQDSLAPLWFCWDPCRLRHRNGEWGGWLLPASYFSGSISKETS